MTARLQAGAAAAERRTQARGRRRAGWASWLAGAALAAGFGPALLAGAQGGQALVPRLEGAQIVEALRSGGYVILMRHTSTDPVAPDPDTFDLRDCDTQRNLSEQGRSEAKQVGEAFRRLGIRVSSVLSSPYCRCLETGRLAFGEVTESDVLSVGEELSVAERSERGGVVRQMLATPPEAGANSVLITHTGTLLYSFGLNSRPEGIAHVFQPQPAGPAAYVGMLTPDQWPALAAEAEAAEAGP